VQILQSRLGREPEVSKGHPETNPGNDERIRNSYKRARRLTDVLKSLNQDKERRGRRKKRQRRKLEDKLRTNFRHHVLRQENIGALHVAMDNAHIMKILQTGGHGAKDFAQLKITGLVLEETKTYIQ
jgi:hypothetical protein